MNISTADYKGLKAQEEEANKGARRTMRQMRKLNKEMKAEGLTVERYNEMIREALALLDENTLYIQQAKKLREELEQAYVFGTGGES